ncbi:MULTISPECIES: hypothetical protein [unclassified Vibrio]|uniref:hypothetical protein n=1 Tax=unclassified Vibrio TaxID=2614977 RepID=UPI001F455CD3|nr:MULTISPECIES: hypothetical protein [unclassified Vibrio]QXL80239.1 hypothetical protein [Vibrio sp.]
MEINNIVDFLIYVPFTIAMLLVGLPVGIIHTIKGVKLFMKYRFQKLPSDLRTRSIGNNALEVFFCGSFSLAVSVWYLFIDKGGNLVFMWKEVIRFFQPLV